MNDLATVFLQQGQWEKARVLLEKVLALRTANLGPGHPDTVAPMMNLSHALRRQGKQPQARMYLDKSLAVCERVYGLEHPRTLRPMSELAGLLLEQREYQHAFDLGQRTLEMQKKVLGPKHSSTLHTQANQALVLEGLGKRQEAWDLLEKTLEDFTEVLGPKHATTLQTMHSLAYMLLQDIRRKDLRKVAEARQRFEQVAALRGEVLGQDHPSTLNTRWGLVEVLMAMDQIPQAVEVFNQIVESLSRIHGPDHPKTLDTRNNFAVQLSNAKKYDAARKLHEANLDYSRLYLGAEHPKTLDTISRLSEVINAQAIGFLQGGDFQKAEQKLREGLAVVKPVEDKLASINDNYRQSVAQLCHNLARCLVVSAKAKAAAAQEAVVLAQKAVKLKPGFRLYWNTLALAQYRSGDLKGAKTTLDTIMPRAKGGDCRDWFLLAMVQWQLGEKEQSRQWFDRAVKQMQQPQFGNSVMARSLRAEAARVLGIKDAEESK
jgi:tetratricopeptide (TPR) repeat protein